LPTPVNHTPGSESDSDGYVNARRNIPTKKQRQRQLLVASGQLPPSRAEVRFSSRRTKQVTNYNEEEEDDFDEDEDADNLPSYGWGSTVEETGPVIDKVLDHRPKDENGALRVSRR
jgi:chromodomain-helicase-DNA-binding protein 1